MCVCVCVYLHYIAGIGATLVYTPFFVVLSSYFDKRLAMGTGISTAGGSFAAVAFPPFIGVLLEHYGYTGTWLILAALVAHILCAGALYRKPSITNTSEVENHLAIPLKDMSDNTREENDNGGPDEENDNFLETKHQKYQEKHSKEGCTHINSEISKKKKWNNCLTQFSKLGRQKDGKKLFDFKVLTNVSLLLCCSGLGVTLWLSAPGLMFLVAIAESRGIPKGDAILLLSIVGLSDALSRIATGFLFDCKPLRPIRVKLYTCAIALETVCFLCIPLCRNYLTFAINCVCIGIGFGVVTSQRTVVIVDLYGAESLSSTVGILAFALGACYVNGPLIGGKYMHIQEI